MVLRIDSLVFAGRPRMKSAVDGEAEVVAILGELGGRARR